ncbi:MAG: galactose mutarotase [Synergistaceae bacterium]|nr:galactose mutarotase [Synergistaceae bacterium]
MNRWDTIEKAWFGALPDGRDVYAYTLFDQNGQSVVMSEYGCSIQKLLIRDREGKLRDVALGYDTLEEYIADTRHFGATIGRYANRIAGGRFFIDDVEYRLPRNNHGNTLHGGPRGFDKRLFTSHIWADSVVFTYVSEELEEGFPGEFTLTATVTFRDGALRMEYEYDCTHATPVSITNHNYFNLNGHGSGTILKHRVWIDADRFCRADDDLLALAPSVPVEGTPFDLREPRPILDAVLSRDREIIRAGGGYDHCFALNAREDGERPAAGAESEDSGIRMEVRTGMPALQFYSGNQIGRVRGKDGAIYNTFDGFALECQQFPNAVNEPSFPPVLIRPGDRGEAFLEYRFRH